ncbi:hypothetical protein [Pontibacillus yanchengensis]|uniref:Transporter n=1 Tax=Pontibacillus yanchengensis Y32 TaxID=1385514 RepID=A0A0A2T6B6_9BACI|nr:hypothetical protein [Pontibacillus yanchengensis]KGP71327.1 transporter [Pontibacillus yanchengensis Y32]
MYDPRQNQFDWLGQLLFPGGGGGGFPGQQQFGPPGPPPGQGGGGQPPFGPPSGQGGFGPPGPPPSSPPFGQGQQAGYGQPGLFAVDPGALRGCLYRYTWVRLNNGRAFWYYPTFIGRTSVAGYRWRRSQQRWVYFGIDTDRISSFSCQ